MGEKRLMDQFHIRSKPGLGTVVELLKILPRKKELIKTQALGKIAAELMREQPGDAAGELRQQNSELLLSLQDLRRQREEPGTSQSGTGGNQPRRGGPVCGAG